MSDYTFKLYMYVCNVMYSCTHELLLNVLYTVFNMIDDICILLYINFLSIHFNAFLNWKYKFLIRHANLN